MHIVELAALINAFIWAVMGVINFDRYKAGAFTAIITAIFIFILYRA